MSTIPIKTAPTDQRRRMLIGVTRVAGAISLLAASVPFITAMRPSARTRPRIDQTAQHIT